jgi:aminoglycoside phosphotransferase (APT) family kinase protein
MNPEELMDPDKLKTRLEQVVRRELGSPGIILSLVALTGGAAKRTYEFSAVVEKNTQRLILQLSSTPEEVVARLTPRLGASEDAKLMRAAAALGVQAPRVRALLVPDDGLGTGFITDFIEAEALGRRIVHDEAFRVARDHFTAQCGRNLAAIHRIPAGDHPYLLSYQAIEQIESYAQLVTHYGVRTPELTYCFAWARQHAPRVSRRTVVHGDFRMGNLLTDTKGLRCVLDWEVAHLGDPMQDLGWLCLRTWRFGGKRPVGGVGNRDELFTAYEAEGGHPVDRDAVHFWEAWGNVKWAIMAMRRGLRFRDGGEPSLEDCAIGRRMEEPLWDFFQVLDEGAC